MINEQNYSILVIDDEVISRKALISGVDWDTIGITQIYEAGTSAAAKEIFRDHEIDIALIDIEMPGEDGLSLLHWIRDNGYEYTQCVFLTCHASFPYAQEAIRLRCTDYLLKPVAYLDLTDILKKMLGTLLKEKKKDSILQYGRQWIREKEEEGHKFEKEAVSTPELIDDTIHYIQNHLSDKLSINDLAIRVSLNPNYLNRAFKEKTGESINKYIIRRRMVLAARLIEENHLKSYAVAAAVGYENYPNFVNMFKKFYGVSPKQYQDEHGISDTVF